MAGALENLGNHFIGMFAGWAGPSLTAAGGLIVVVTMIRRFSLKAGIGAALAFVAVLGIYQSRTQLASMFSNEVQSATTNGAAQHSLLPLPGRGDERL
jgi:hypothetical protein